VYIVGAAVFKGGAVCGRLWLQNSWLNAIVAWGGGMLGGFCLVTALLAATNAGRIRRTLRRTPPEQWPDPTLAKADSLRPAELLIVLAILAVFALVGNPLSPGCVVLFAVFAPPLAILIVTGREHARTLSAERKQLPIRKVARAENWPAAASLPQAIFPADSRTARAPTGADAPPTVKVNPDAGVQFRVFCAGAPGLLEIDVAILFDGQWIGIGSRRRGFDARCETTPGPHELQLRKGITTQTFLLHLAQPGAYEAELRYSSWAAKYVPHSGQE
jgi:hypothetical protein